MCFSGRKNPILSIHDVGAGGYSNAFPELIEASECGENLSCGIFRILNLE
ncbi:AIR synthase-related protein [Candidatus Coxiella mudrowiae]